MRVVIAEDLALLRLGIASLLTDKGHEVVATVGDGQALLAAAAEHRPDLVIVDVRMPPTQTDEGVRAAVELRRRQPEVGILILSQYVDERYATDLLSGGSNGVGYLLKDRVADVSDSSRPRAGSPPAVRRSTPRSSPSCSAVAGAPISSTI